MRRALVLALAFAGCGSEPTVVPDGPLAGRSVVLIVADTLRADALPMYGGDSEAPFLEQLASEGVVFDEAASPSSCTSPATASIFTGVYPDQHGVLFNENAYRRARGRSEPARLNRIPPQAETLPAYFQSLGYRTYGIADNPNIGDRMGFSRGFDHFRGRSYEGSDDVLGHLESIAAEIRDGEGPFFLYLHLMDPHAPYHERSPWYVEPEETGDESADKHARILAQYASEIAYLDHHVREAYELLGLDDALVLFTADHGEEFGDHGGAGHGRGVYDELTRVPFFVRAPGGSAGTRIGTRVSTVDVLPTLRGLLGTPAGELDEGTDLSPVILGAGEVEHRTLFSVRDRETERWRAVYRDRFKLIVTRPGDRRPGETVELYDLDADPREERNLAAEHPDLVAELLAELETHENRPRTLPRSWAPPKTLSESEVADLERLGYAGDE